MGKKRKKSSQGPVSADASPISEETSEPAPAVVVTEEPVVAAVIVGPTPTPAIAETTVQVSAATIAAVVESLPEVEPDPDSSELSVREIIAAGEVAPESEAAPSSAAASSAPKKKKKKKKRSTKPPVTREALDQKIDQLEAKLEVKKEKAAQAAREGFGSSPALDDQSVPPVEAEVHDEFFAAGEKAPMVRDASGAWSPVDARHAQKMTAEAHARRAHLSRYVKWSVGAAAAILLLGVGIKSLRPHPNDEPIRHEVTHVAAPVVEPTQAPQENVVTQLPTVTEVNEVIVGDDTKTATNDMAADAKAADDDKKPEDMPAEKPKNAYQEKQAAKAALERGSNGAAVAAGERSVALDPSDGESWLVLGGAYQAMGNAGQAKRCYNACVSQGKKGPIGDCKDMLSGM